MCQFHAFWVGSNPTRNNFLRFLKQNNKREKLWKNRKFRRNIGKSRRNIGIYRKFSGKIGQTKFLCIFLFEAHRKTIFRRNIGRKNRNFCPCSQRHKGHPFRLSHGDQVPHHKRSRNGSRRPARDQGMLLGINEAKSGRQHIRGRTRHARRGKHST